jgi:hypothetical protein
MAGMEIMEWGVARETSIEKSSMSIYRYGRCIVD